VDECHTANEESTNGITGQQASLRVSNAFNAQANLWTAEGDLSP